MPVPDTSILIQQDHSEYRLDPFSVIVKLAILSNKPVGTKICIAQNVLSFQEPGPFQSLCRYVYQATKTDLQYMYNPIQIACTTFLSKSQDKNRERIRALFVSAQRGLERLMETYKSSAIIQLCLNYFHVLISHHVDELPSDKLFRKDTMSSLYTPALIQELNGQWTQERMKVVLDLIGFLKTDNMASVNVKSLETILDVMDQKSRTIFTTLYEKIERKNA
jgi:hypothetical protein